MTTSNPVVDPNEIVLNVAGTSAMLTQMGQDQLCSYNLAWLKRQPAPEVLSKYAAKQQRNGRGTA